MTEMKRPPSFKILETCAMKENKHQFFHETTINNGKVPSNTLRVNLLYLYNNAKKQVKLS